MPYATETETPCTYVAVERPAMDADLRRVAERYAKALARNLGLRQVVTVRWFEPLAEGADARGRKTLTLDGPHTGYFCHDEPYVVWVKVGLSAVETARVIAHEVKHAEQFQELGGYEQYRHTRTGWAYAKDARERDARAFAEKCMPWWHG